MIIFFSGTGNSRFIAEKIAEQTGDKTVDAAYYIRRKKGAHFTDSGPYVFIAPVYVSAPPVPFLQFLRHSAFPAGCPTYFVMTCAGGMAAAPWYCRKLSEEKGFSYMGTVEIDMPQNYLLFFKMHPPSHNREKVKNACTSLDSISDSIHSLTPLPEPAVKKWEIAATRMVLAPYYKHFMSAKGFRATKDCIGCGKCAAACPMSNISMEMHKPSWGSKCIHCMACINLCPKEAIEYGRHTRGKLRYHGPDSLFR